MTLSISGRSPTGLGNGSTEIDRGGSFERLLIVLKIRRRAGIEQQRDPCHGRRGFLNQFQPFRGHRSFDIDEAGRVAAGVGQSGYEPTAHRIGDEHEHHWYRPGLAE